MSVLLTKEIQFIAKLALSMALSQVLSELIGSGIKAFKSWWKKDIKPEVTANA